MYKNFTSYMISWNSKSSGIPHDFVHVIFLIKILHLFSTLCLQILKNHLFVLSSKCDVVKFQTSGFEDSVRLFYVIEDQYDSMKIIWFIIQICSPVDCVRLHSVNDIATRQSSYYRANTLIRYIYYVFPEGMSSNPHSNSLVCRWLRSNYRRRVGAWPPLLASTLFAFR